MVRKLTVVKCVNSSYSKKELPFCRHKMHVRVCRGMQSRATFPCRLRFCLYACVSRGLWVTNFRISHLGLYLPCQHTADGWMLCLSGLRVHLQHLPHLAGEEKRERLITHIFVCVGAASRRRAARRAELSQMSSCHTGD
jgi:hypothetical protein